MEISYWMLLAQSVDEAYLLFDGWIGNMGDAQVVASSRITILTYTACQEK